MAVNIRILGEFDNRAFKQAENALGGLQRAAGIALGALAAGAATAAVVSIREFANFDAALTKSVAIMGDVSDAMRNDMAAAARQVALETTFSAEQAAESFFFLASAGLDAESSIAALPQVAAFAQAGMFDMALATDLLTDAQSALGLTIRDDAVANMENMVRVSDVLVRANTLANASVEQFSTSLTTKAGAAMRSLGIEVEEGVAVLAAFADQGIKGEIAGTQLAIVLRDLTTKGIQNKEAFKQFGVSVFDSNGEMNNLADIVGDLEGALAGMSDETQKATLLQLGFSDKSLSSLQALLGTSEAIRQYESDLRQAGGTTQDVAGKQLETLNSQLQLLQSAFLDVAINVGEQMAPAFGELVERVKELLPELGERLIDALSKIDFAKIAEDVLNFTVAVVENIDQIIEVAKQIAILAAVIITFKTALGIATTAQTLFNAVVALNPYVIIATAAAAAALGIAAFVGKVNENRAALEEQATATGRTVEEQKAYNYELIAYLQAQANVRDGVGMSAHAVGILSQNLHGMHEELVRAENFRLGNLRAEFQSAANAAIQARYQVSLLNEDLRKIARFGQGGTQPPSVTDFIVGTGAGAAGAGAEARDYVQEFFDGLGDEVRKQQARLQLQNLGLSEGLINSILGAQNFDEVFDHIIKGGRRVAEELQREFNKTAAGLAEITRFESDQANRLADEAARREAMIMGIVQASFDAANDRFEKFRDLLRGFTESMTGAFSSFRNVLFPTEQFGQFEGAVVSLERSLYDLLAAQTELFTAENRQVLETYLRDSANTMRAVGFARDQLAKMIEAEQQKLQQQIEARQSMFDAVFDRIIGSADISKFRGGAESIIKQLRRSVEQAINFERQLDDLRALGLTDRALAQIEAAGVESGSATARALLRGGAGAIAEVNELYGQLADVAEAQAAAQSSELFDSGIAMAEGLIEGLLSQADQMRVAAEILAAVFEQTFTDAVGSAAIQFREPNMAAIEASTREFFDWLDSLPEMAGGEQREIRGGRVVSGPGTGQVFEPSSPPVDYTQPISGMAPISITINAGMGADGAAIGDLIVKALKEWELRNGPLSGAVRHNNV
jgi:TP901 family phage tail tape measure protein